MKVLLDSEASPLKKQNTIFERSGYKIDFSEEFLNSIVDLSYKSAVGTRALDSYVKQSVSAASFDLLGLSKIPANKGNILITEECLSKPELYQKSKIHVASSIGASFQLTAAV